MKRLSLFLVLVTLLIISEVHAQLTTNSSVSAAILVQNTLIGGGVVASNITYSGDNDAVGFFNGSNCNIGLSSGVILTTGTVENSTSMFGDQEGPFGPNNIASSGVDNGYAGDPLLESIVNNTTYNASVLEFDFTAVGDEVSFKYVFASEEYLEYVNAGYNDVFGFFISGPNPGGGNYVNTNIAKVPGNNMAVSIDNVNNLVNNSYYIDNGDGFSSPQNSSSFYVQYDGFTVPLTANASLVCGATYHIKIAICDVGDGQYDSGVFLEEQSFISHSPVEVNIAPNVPSPNLAFNQIYEGCGSVNVALNRLDSINYTQTFHVSYSGGANPNIDFIGLPNSVTFSPGQTQQSFTVEGVYDNLNEGSEALIISIQYFDVCGNLQIDQVSIDIIDQPQMQLIMPSDTVLGCESDDVVLMPQITGGVAPYSYSWSDGSTQSVITVGYGSSGVYTLTVTDACGEQTINGSTVVDVQTYQPISVDLGDDVSVFCPNEEVQLISNVTGGYGEYTYNWSNGGTAPSTIIQTLITDDFWLLVEDGCGVQQPDTIKVNVVGSVLETSTYGSGEYCKGELVTFGVEASGGAGGYTYLWSSLDTTSEVSVLAENNQYFVEVQDACGTYSIYDTVTIMTTAPTADFTTANEDVVINTNQYFTNLSTGAVNYYWDFGNGETSTDVNPYTTFTEEENVEVMLVARDVNGCVDTTYKTIIVRPHMIYFVPNAFTPNGDGANDVFIGKGVGVKVSLFQIFDRWGELIFSSTNPRASWDGTYNGKNVQNGVYIYKIQLNGYDHSDFEKTGHVTLIR